jgi:hypothetical protein
LKRTHQWSIWFPSGLLGRRRAACTGPVRRLLARSLFSIHWQPRSRGVSCFTRVPAARIA